MGNEWSTIHLARKWSEDGQGNGHELVRMLSGNGQELAANRLAMVRNGQRDGQEMVRE